MQTLTMILSAAALLQIMSLQGQVGTAADEAKETFVGSFYAN